MRGILIACWIFWLYAAAAAADVYRWSDEQGRIHYAARAPAGVDAVAIPDAPDAAGTPAPASTLRPGERLMLQGIAADRPRPTATAEVDPASAQLEILCNRANERALAILERMRGGYKSREYNGLMAAARRAQRDQQAYCR
jgi:hypothetical protein